MLTRNNFDGSRFIEYPTYQEYDSRQNAGNQFEPVPTVSYQNPTPNFNFQRMQPMPRLGGLDTVFLPAHDKYHAAHHKTKPKPQTSKIVDPKDTYLCKVSVSKKIFKE